MVCNDLKEDWFFEPSIRSFWGGMSTVEGGIYIQMHEDSGLRSEEEGLSVSDPIKTSQEIHGAQRDPPCTWSV